MEGLNIGVWVDHRNLVLVSVAEYVGRQPSEFGFGRLSGTIVVRLEVSSRVTQSASSGSPGLETADPLLA